MFRDDEEEAASGIDKSTDKYVNANALGIARAGEKTNLKERE